MNLPGLAPQITAELGLSGRTAIIHDTTTRVMTTRDRSIIFDTGGAAAVTLPPVVDSAGMLFFIMLTTDGGAVTINDAGDDTDFVAVVIRQVNYGVIMYSDGVHWFALPHTTGNYGS